MQESLSDIDVNNYIMQSPPNMSIAGSGNDEPVSSVSSRNLNNRFNIRGFSWLRDQMLTFFKLSF